jgi:hypothetical protein
MGKFGKFFDAVKSGKNAFTEALQNVPTGRLGRQGKQGGALSKTDQTAFTKGARDMGSELDGKSASKQQEIISDATGVSKTDVKAKMEDPNVKAAAETKKSDLAKLGLKGAAGVAVLMILTGETNPITAIRKAVKATSDAAQKGLGIFGDLLDFFSNYGMYISLASSCLVMLLVSVMLLK